ncbi:CpsD/CapB family tyrosine-protein kinase [Enterococcus hirae]|nr:CpsD/CapB family tyrosine-protein kinase [Enterococcus hirae]
MGKLLIDVVTFIDPDSPISEQYRGIRTNIEHVKSKENIQTIFFTSANSGEGKSTTIINLAVVFAKTGKKVLMVDCDIRKQSLSESFNVQKAGGFVRMLEERSKLSDEIYSTNVTNLSFLPSGQPVKNPAEILLNPSLSEVVSEMKEQFDLIFFDTPPISEVADTQILSTKLDRCILIVRENYSSKDAVVKAKETLDHMGVKYLGIIHNYANTGTRNFYGGRRKKYGYGISDKKKSAFRFWK